MSRSVQHQHEAGDETHVRSADPCDRPQVAIRREPGIPPPSPKDIANPNGRSLAVEAHACELDSIRCVHHPAAAVTKTKRAHKQSSANRVSVQPRQVRKPNGGHASCDGTVIPNPSARVALETEISTMILNTTK